MPRLAPRVLLLAAATLLFPLVARGQEVMCDPAHEDCRTPLLNLVRDETERIDIAMWFMEDQGLADAIVARFRGGLPVRAIVDPRRNTTTPMNAVILAQFRDAGIPMRNKTDGGILHWKFMIFNSQDKVEWSAANYGDYYFRPATPYLDYTDEGIYFTDDQAIVNSFRRKFDDTWVLTTGFANYANVTSPSRAYPLYAIDPDMSFVPAEDFSVRSRPFYDAENQGIDVIMYKITEGTHADGLIRARSRGVPVRLITEPDLYRDPSNIWQAYQVDRLYNAGVQIRVRAHAGFLHQKSTVLYGQRRTIYGSSNWTIESNRNQYEHNYFTAKAWFFDWFADNFDRKWRNRTGNAETAPFAPLPPDAPIYAGLANGATGIGTTASLSWKPGPWGHRADVYFGTASNPPLLAGNVSVSPGGTKTYALPTLTAGTTYYWRIVNKTIANQGATGPVYSFTTAGGTPPPPPPPPPPASAGSLDIVLYASAGTPHGAWRDEADPSAAGGHRVHHPNAYAAKLTTPLASPVNFLELTFNAEAGRGYRLWIRGKADGNSYANDSLFVQFSGSTTASGAATWRIGTTSATDYNLEACSGCGLAEWGWEDNGWGTGVLGPLVYFAATGPQTVRLQTREDGLAIDQVVLSAGAYLSTSPGATRNDATILPATSGGTTPPPSGEIALYAAESTTIVGNWTVENDGTAAGGRRIHNPNAGIAKIVTASASPASYFELSFNAEAGRAYRLWIRGRGQDNHYSNDSVHVQFSGSVTQAGTAVYRIGTTASTEFNLESCSGCGISNWGWEDNGWGSGVLGPLIYFATTGPQRIRIQPREDGLAIDQIVLSPSRFLTASPGAARNDATILPEQGGLQ